LQSGGNFEGRSLQKVGRKQVAMTRGKLLATLRASVTLMHKLWMLSTVSNNIFVVAENNIHDGHLDNLKSLLGEMFDAVERSEPGTLNYEWFITDDGTSVHVCERYADSEAFLQHLGNLRQNYAEQLFACLAPTKIMIYRNPNDAVREIFVNFPTTYISP
jgi:autoinducer 2-degrading protein